ncbi:MAG TPA: hypothetical protein VFZ34_13975 [Blastocatellia bacterium]|nr:hypothetical protein [Blastocatellia bacterium]
MKAKVACSKAKGKSGLQQGKRRKAKGKSLFGSKTIFFRFPKALKTTEGGIKRKNRADLLPFHFCLLPSSIFGDVLQRKN